MIALRRIVASVAVSGGLALIVGAAQAAPGDALEACLAKCNRGKLSETNRETCRLDCEVDASTDPDLIRAEIERRHPKKKEDGGVTGASGASTGAGTAVAGSGGGRAACKARCDADRSLSVDDRATCKLECDFDDDPGSGAGSDPVASGTGEPLLPRAPMPPGAGWPATPVPPVAGGTVAPMGFLPMCLQTCRRGPVRLRPTDIETCRLTCENAASLVDFAFDAIPSPWMSVPTAAPEAVAVKLPGPPALAGGRPPAVAGPPVSAPPVSAPPGTCEEALTTCKGACEKLRTSCERDCGRGRLNATDRESCKLDCGTGVELCRADCTGDHATCANRR